MEKFTVWFGQYLTGRYDLTDAHSEAITAEWERCADFAAQTLPLCQGARRREHEPEPQ